jgi:putative toxin-antitoxin system antitoxin component (TIGR02293 family)
MAHKALKAHTSTHTAHRALKAHTSTRSPAEQRAPGGFDFLTSDESGQAVRAARVLSLAEQVFANRDKAFSWMRKAKKRVHGEAPMKMLQTEAGTRLVEQMLIQLDEG